MTTRDSGHEQKWLAQLDEWDAEINRLSAQVKEGDPEVRSELKEKLAIVADKQNVARKHMEDLTNAGEQSWRHAWNHLEHARSDVADALQAVKEKLS